MTSHFVKYVTKLFCWAFCRQTGCLATVLFICPKRTKSEETTEEVKQTLVSSVQVGGAISKIIFGLVVKWFVFCQITFTKLPITIKENEGWATQTWHFKSNISIFQTADGDYIITITNIQYVTQEFPSCVLVRQAQGTPPLDYGTGWTWDLWLKNNLLK